MDELNSIEVIRPPKPLTLSKLAAKINTEHAATTRAAREMIRHILRCGDYLLEAKRQLPHGQFEDWLETNCETLGVRMARYYMQMSLRWETLGIPQKKAIEGLKSFRQIRDALLDKPRKMETTKKKPRRTESECDFRGCVVRGATVISRCDKHMLDAFKEWLDTVSLAKLEEIRHTVSGLIDAHRA